MEYRQILLILLLIFSHTFCRSQVYVFIVCGNQGDNSVMKNGEWKILKTGLTIEESDQLKLNGDNCYLGLLHTSGRSLVIRKPGAYKATDLLQKLNPGNASVASKYADFVYSKMTTASVESASEKHRSAGDRPITLFLPPSCEWYGPEEIIGWSPVDEKKTYKIVFKNVMDEVIKELESEGHFCLINFNENQLKNHQVLFISVYLAENPGLSSGTCAIKRMDAAKAQKISKDFLEIKMDIGEESSLNDLILAAFFENHQLLIDAATYYHQAVTHSPGIRDFEILYEQFLVRNGIW